MHSNPKNLVILTVLMLLMGAQAALAQTELNPIYGITSSVESPTILKAQIRAIQSKIEGLAVLINSEKESSYKKYLLKSQDEAKIQLSKKEAELLKVQTN